MSESRIRADWWVVAAGAMLLSPGPAVFGAEPGAERSNRLLEEIVVTAQKREASVQDVAIAMTAFSGEQIEQLGMDQGYQISDQVPNFNFNAAGGESSPVQYLNIRGVQIVDFSLANDPSVAVYLDEVYQPSQGSAIAQLFDVDRVEVLRGPQGTLFGRNTTGGLLHFVSRKPTDQLDGYVHAGYGEFDRQTYEAALSGPLGERVRGRVAVKYLDQDGWQEDVITGEDSFGSEESWAARGILEADIGDSLAATLTYHAAESDGITPARGFYGSLDPTSGERCAPERVLDSQCVNAAGLRDPDPDPENVYADAARESDSESRGASLNLAWSLDWGEIVSVTGYEYFDGLHGGQFAPPGNFAIGFNWGGDAESFSQELRASGETLGGGTWVAGVYYYEDEKDSESATIVNLGAYNPLRRTTSTDAWALFAQMDNRISETLTLVTGIRYTDESRSLDDMYRDVLDPASGTRTEIPVDFSGVDSDISSSELTGKLALEWRPSEQLLGYVSFSRGYKSGGFNPSTNIQQIGPVEPEVLYSWEAGWKADLANGLLRLNGAVFYYDFQGYQSVVTTTRPSGLDEDQFIVETNFLNAGDADIYGAELEVSYLPTDNLFLSFGLGLLDTELSSPDFVTIDNIPVDGNELPNAPDYSLNGIVRYSIPAGDSGTFSLQADFRYQDDIFHNIDNAPFETQEAYGVGNVRGTWRSADQRWSVEAFVENVFDEEYTLQSVFSTTLAAASRSWGRPQWWGISVGYDFGR